MSTNQDDSANKAPPVVARALRLLCHKARSAAELRAALAEEGYDAAAVAQALQATRGWGYVNDDRLADAVGASALRRGRGTAWLKQQLTRRALTGVDTTALQAAHRQAEPAQVAELLARRYGRKGALATPKLQARAIRFLLGRGFASATVQAAVQKAARGAAAMASATDDSCDEGAGSDARDIRYDDGAADAGAADA